MRNEETAKHYEHGLLPLGCCACCGMMRYDVMWRDETHEPDFGTGHRVV